MAGHKLSTEAGYEKYFKQLKTNIDVKLKVMRDQSSVELKSNDGSTISVPAGTSVEFIKESNLSHGSWYVVNYRNNAYKVRAENIVKPGRENVPSLKPQKIGVVGAFNNSESVIQAASEGLSKLNNLDEETQQYLSCLLMMYSNNSNERVDAKNQILKNFTVWKSLPLKEIAKDFSEVLGALEVASAKPSIVQSIIFNEGLATKLIDYSIVYRINGIKTTRGYSAKTSFSTTANTIKFSHVYESILNLPPNQKQDFMKKWSNNWIFQCVETAFDLMSSKKGASITNDVVVEKMKMLTGTNCSGSNGVKSRFISNRYHKEIKNFFSDFSLLSYDIVNFDFDSRGFPVFKHTDSIKSATIDVKASNEQIGFRLHF